MVIDPMTAPHFTRPCHIADAPTALAASIAAQAQTRELNALRTERDTLLNALRQIATTEACGNSDPEVMGKALDNCVAIAQGAAGLPATRTVCRCPRGCRHWRGAGPRGRNKETFNELRNQPDRRGGRPWHGRRCRA